MKQYEHTLSGKTVIVTAGNQGGGAVVAQRFAASGANVIIIANKVWVPNQQTNIHAIAEKITAAGGFAITFEVNLADANEINNTVNEIASQFGRIDILVNNFSIFNFKNAHDTTAEEFNKVINNVFATFFFSQACIPFLRDSDNPHVINIAPPLDMQSAKEACEHHLLFSISKYGMSFCTMGMAAEFKKWGIAFNSLWEARPHAGQTLEQNFLDEVTRGSNKPELYAEAAYLISLKPSKEFSGNYCVDEQILLEAGIDITQYAVDPGATPVKDIFLPGVNYEILKSVMKPQPRIEPVKLHKELHIP